MTKTNAQLVVGIDAKYQNDIINIIINNQYEKK